MAVISCTVMLHEALQTLPPTALPPAALGALRKTDIFLERDLLITLHPGHAVMSYSTISLESRGDVGNSRSFGEGGQT